MNIKSGRDSLVAGFLGAAASIIGKISLAPDSPFVQLSYDSCSLFRFAFCVELSWATRALGLCMMVYSNILMAFYLLRALEKNESVSVTVISSSSNLLFSGLLGYVALGETIGICWIIGSCFISGGVLLVLSCQQSL